MDRTFQSIRTRRIRRTHRYLPDCPHPTNTATCHYTTYNEVVPPLNLLSMPCPRKSKFRQHRLYNGAEIAEPGARLRRGALPSSAPHHNAKTVTSLRVQHPGAAT